MPNYFIISNIRGNGPYARGTIVIAWGWALQTSGPSSSGATPAT